jgi:D-alanyl-D-alanine carboxypeptidase
MQTNPTAIRVLLACTLSGCVQSQLDDLRSPTVERDLQAIVDDAVAREVTVGAVIEVSRPHRESISASAGVADLDSERAIDSHDHFRGGSILKTFVATAVLQSVEEGKLGLDDSITQYLEPELTDHIAHARSITLRMLLSHRSGIAEWETPDIDQRIAQAPEHIWKLEEILALVAKNGPAFEPGAKYGYSNTNYELLGEIITRACGRDWRDVVRESVFERAGLRDTSLPVPGDLECIAPCAHGYVRVDDRLEDFSAVDPSMAGAAGGHALITTAADLTKFLSKLQSGALFRERSTRETMFDFEEASEPETHTVGYGLGVAKFEANGLVAYGHLGGTIGYQSFMLYVPEAKTYLSGFINQLGGLGDVLVPALAGLSEP